MTCSSSTKTLRLLHWKAGSFDTKETFLSATLSITSKGVFGAKLHLKTQQMHDIVVDLECTPVMTGKEKCLSQKENPDFVTHFICG